MKLILLGAPGAGKGTVAKLLTALDGSVQISTGDILRGAVRAGTELGREAEGYMKRGDLVPDSLIMGIMEKRLQEPDCPKGFLLDAFPRTIPQAEALDKILPALGQKINVVLNIDVPDEELVKRVTGRRMCKCGATYHITFNKPKVEGKCDACGGLGQVIAKDAETDLAVLRVHSDLTPRAVFAVGGRAAGRRPATAFLIRGGEAVDQRVVRVELGTLRGVRGVQVVDVSPVPPADAVGAPCVDGEGRLLGVVALGEPARSAGQLALVTDRIGALLAEARRAADAAQAAAASERSVSAARAARDGVRPPSRPREDATVESDTDRARREGADTFDRTASRLASQREDVIKLRAKYDVECVGTYVMVAMVPGVGWPYPGGYVVEKSELPECKALQDLVDGRAGRCGEPSRMRKIRRAARGSTRAPCVTSSAPTVSTPFDRL